MGITQVTKYRTPPEYSEGDAASYDNIYFQTDLWYWWLIEAYPQNQAKRVKFALVGIRTICIRWRKNNVTRGMFKLLEENIEFSRELRKDYSC